MGKIAHRVVIRYLDIKDLPLNEIHEDMVATQKEDDHACFIKFKRSRESLEDFPRLGRFVAIATQETIGKICDMVLEDRRITDRFIAT